MMLLIKFLSAIPTKQNNFDEFRRPIFGGFTITLLFLAGSINTRHKKIFSYQSSFNTYFPFGECSTR